MLITESDKNGFPTVLEGFTNLLIPWERLKSGTTGLSGTKDVAPSNADNKPEPTCLESDSKVRDGGTCALYLGDTGRVGEIELLELDELEENIGGTKIGMGSDVDDDELELDPPGKLIGLPRIVSSFFFFSFCCEVGLGKD